jgi:aspartate-semialdehyde dehydrogenase
MALTATFKDEIPISTAIQIIKNAKGVEWINNIVENHYAMPITASGKDKVQVSRIRKMPGKPRDLVLWIVGDQVRKGAALNAVHIAEELLKIM